MLSSFYIKNFRSILELKLDFTFGEGKAPNGYKDQEIMPFIEAPNKKRLVPCMAFFGANASGKTNILKAFGEVEALIEEGAELSDVYDPHLLHPKYSDSCFAIEFILSGDVFEYRVSYDAKKILNETLSKNGKSVYAINELKAKFSPDIRSATYSEKKLTEILRVECSDGEGGQNKLFLHRIGKGYLGLNADLKNVFHFIKNGLIFYLNESSIPLPAAVDILSSVMDGGEAAALREITDVVRRLDIDIQAIDIHQVELGPDDKAQYELTRENPKTGEKHGFQITSTHKDVAGNMAVLNFIKHESDGTQRLAGLVGLILFALKTGGVLLVDELECSLHPLLMREIVLLFKKKTYNPKGAQLIVTTHNTDILDDSILRLSEIALVRKTIANGTLVRRLVDVKNDGEDIRNVTNFRKQYLSGFYSGVPHPAL